MWPNKRRSDEDFRREIEAHVALETDRLIEEGLPPEEARSRALRAFGNVLHAQERFYESGRAMWWDDARRDVTYAFRGFAKSPGFAVVAVLTLALGIGATTAIFSLLNALLLNPLPYQDSHRLARLMVNLPAIDGSGPRRRADGITVAELVDLRASMKTVSHLGVYGLSLMTLTGRGEAVRLEGTRISPAMFEALGVRPLRGRLFRSDEEAPDAAPVVILSYALWQRIFGGDPNVVGTTVTLEDNLRRMIGKADYSKQYDVIGVMPEGFRFPSTQTGFWIPALLASPGGGAVLARLADGASWQAASAEVDGLLRMRRKNQPSARFELAREDEELVAPVKPALLVLMAAVALVLLIAWGNVANLLLARAAARQREMAIRSALGAGRGRLLRQRLTECLLLTWLGGMGGLAVAFGGIRLLQALATTLSRMDLGNLASFPRLDEVAVDATVFAFVVALSVLAAFVFALAPVAGRFRWSHVEALKEGAGSSVVGFGGMRRLGTRAVLVVLQISMAMMLLFGSGLLIHSFLKLLNVDPGYNASNVLTFQVALSAKRYSVTQLKDFAEKLAKRLEATPGVQAAAYAHQLPTVALRQTAQFRRTPAPAERPAPGPSSEDARLVSHAYFQTLGVPIVAGRGFTESDGLGRPRVLVINQALARRAFPGQNAIGQIAYVGRDQEPWQIVGIAADVRQFRFDQSPEPQVFVDFRQWPGTSPLGDVPQYFAVRTQANTGSVLSSVRSAVRQADPEAGLYNVATMEQLVANSMSRSRMYAVLVAVFASIAVALAAIGIYGMMAYFVVQRTREIGIRMALGAQRGTVVGMVVGHSLFLIVLGMTLGALGAASLSRYLKGLLFGLTPLDPATILGVSVAFLLLAVVACSVPAHRATRIDPVLALRHD